MKPYLTVLALVVLLVAPLRVAAEEEPTREQVLEALRTWNDGPADERGEARLRAWGEAALPALGELARGSAGFGHAHEISRALQRIGTAKAADLFVTLLAGKTRVPGFMVLATLETHPTLVRRDFLKHLDEHDDFRDAVWKYAKGTFRARVVKVSALMGWVDTAPKIRAMLEDGDLDVREAAAEALRELTGEELQVERPDLAFPAVDEREGLLEVPVPLPFQGRRDPDLAVAMPWFDGKARLVCGYDPGIVSLGDRGELRVLTDALEEHAAWPMPHDQHALVCVPAPEGRRQLVGLVDDEEGEQSWRTVMAWSEDGVERWRRKTPERFMKDIAPLYGEKGPVGIAIAAGGHTGVVAVDLEGKPLWDVPKQFVLYGLSTHPRLPGYVLAAGGSATIFGHRDKEVAVHFATSRVYDFYVGHGVMFPDDEGAPSVVIAGKVHAGDVPTLRRIDEKGETVWSAVFPVDIEGLALLEPRNGPRLLAVTTDRGELCLVDDAGTLRWRGEMPGADPEGGVATYQLAAGEIGPAAYGVMVRLLSKSYLYRLDLDALRAPKDR